MATSFSKYEIANLPFAASYYGENGWNTEDKTTPKMFTKEECTPAANGGKPISRDKMNKVGYLATIGAFLDRIGYPYGNVDIPTSSLPYQSAGEEFGGYPKGAIVRIYDEEQKVSREYISLVDNNTDNAPWSYDYKWDPSDTDNTGFRGNDYWKPLFNLNQYNYFPDYSNRTTLLDISVVGKTQSNTITIQKSGWLYITRTFPNWEKIPDNILFSKWASETSVRLFCSEDYVNGRNGDAYSIERIYPFEGMVSTRMLPIGTHPYNSNYVIETRNTVNSNDFGPCNVKVELIGFEQES